MQRTPNADTVTGWSIKSFNDGEIIPLFYNKIFSDQSELQYAFSDLPFVCKPSGRRHGGYLTSGTSMALNLGEVLRGDRIVVSDYELVMGEEQDIRYLCSVQVDAKGLERARQLIRDQYVSEWIVDNLPGATSFVSTDGSSKYYAAGFKLGFEDFDRETGQMHYYINNHVTLMIRHRRAPGRDGDKGKKVIVGFEVYPRSIEAVNRNKTTGLPEDLYNVENGMLLDLSANKTYTGEGEPELLTIPYTYSVYFRDEEKMEWQNRWDMYFVAQEDSSKIHWFAIVNAIVIAGLLAAIVAVVLARTFRGEIKAAGFKDMEDGKLKIKKIIKGTRSPRKSTDKPSSGLLEQLDVDLDADLSDDEIEDLTGWKLVHADVFRSPAFGVWLAPLVGSGTQLTFMATGLLLLSCFGILNPSFRGGYISIGVALFVFAGLFSGYFSGRIYRTFGGQLWQKNVIITGGLIPGLLFATIFVLNLFVWAQASSTAIPFGTLIALLAMWLLIQLPLVYIGSWFGFVRVGEYSHPVRPNAIPRQIPVQPWYTRSLHSALLAGLIPFAVIFIELMFLFQSLWQDKSGYYYLFGFLTLISILLLLAVVETSIIATYLLLCAENYHWWWHSFLVGGSSSVWIFGYAVWYYWFKLHITGVVSSMLFFAYTGMACAVYGLLTGTVGFLASYAFVRRIYR
jgi:transmembrane 9 superfamily member 2/4